MGDSASICVDDTRIRRADCQHCAIRSRMLFSDLDIAAAEPHLGTVTNISYQPGALIYRQGDKPSALFSLRTGVVKLSLVSAEGAIRIVRLLGPGAVLGLEVQQGLPYHHTAETINEVNLCRLPTDAVRQLATQQPILYEGILRQWNEHTELADSHLLSLSMGLIRERVLVLLRLLDDLCRKGDQPLHLPGNEDCAKMLGTRVESVSRVMAELKRSGILRQSEEAGWVLSEN